MVFDVDGVLVDTEASFTESVVRAIGWLRANDPALAGDTTPIDRATVRDWKRAGDWNNDWDLSFGVYCWRVGAPALLSTAAATLGLEELSRRAGRTRFGYDDVKGVFEELYNGTAVAIARYGVVGRVGTRRGLAADETVLLRPALLDALRAEGLTKIGVVTGRVRADWDQVRERIPLPVDIALATDEDGRKPDPAPLAKVLEALGSRAFVAVGDTLNDLRMVQAYDRARSAGPAPARPHITGAAILICPAVDEAFYRDAGARATIRALDELPAAVRALGDLETER